eukprot:CCRYP_005066-RA/>CCRYP_005066-RA protein AED:0.60 eAED:0.60 QI:0/0/0/0.5/0/0/2/0/81
MSNATYQDDDDNDDDDFESCLLSNTTTNTEGQLTPAQVINTDNMLATLFFNSIIFVILLDLYEILRHYIPSIYSQQPSRDK